MNADYTIQGSQGNFSFVVSRDITTPCPHCGIPSCGEEAFLWYEEHNKRITVIYDGPALEWAISEYLDQAGDSLDSVPAFLRDWSMDTGWSDCDHPDGFILDNELFIEGITALTLVLKGDVAAATVDLLEQLLSHANEASKRSLSLRIYHS